MSEANTFEGIPITLLPNHACVTCAVDASYLFRHVMFVQTELWRQGHEHVTCWYAIEIGFCFWNIVKAEPEWAYFYSKSHDADWQT